jgi:hypothetical protein
LTIAFSVLRFTDSDYPFGIFKLFPHRIAFYKFRCGVHRIDTGGVEKVEERIFNQIKI